MTDDALLVELDADYKPLRERVHDTLRGRIIDGIYQPGHRMVELELADQLGVSRAPVREALRALESEGFVTVVPRKGVVVSVLTARDVQELFDIREALDVLACRRAAERATPAELAELKAQVEAARSALKEQDFAKFGRANEAFHDKIIELAQNGHLARLVQPLQGRLHWLLRQTDRPAELCEEHDALYRAIASGDPEGAGAEALRHDLANRAIALKVLFQAEKSET